MANPITGRRRVMEFSSVETNAPDPTALLAEAGSEAPRMPEVCARDYAAVVHELRGKNLSWPEVMEWLKDRGADFSESAIISAYRKVYGPNKR